MHIDATYRPAGSFTIGLYHPTFLYECLWNLAAASVLIAAERRFRLTHGRLFALYTAAGRAWVEALQITTPTTTSACDSIPGRP